MPATRTVHARVLYNGRSSAVMSGYEPGDPLREGYAGDVELPADELGALGRLSLLLDPYHAEDPAAWAEERRRALGRLPERAIRPGDVVVFDAEQAYTLRMMFWDALDHVPTVD